MPNRISLSELAASGVRLHPAEAVAIVSEICRQHDRGVLRGMPSAHIVRLTEHGSVVVEGPVNTDRAPVNAAGSLLDELLENFDAPAEYRAPGALRLVVARALGTLDLPAYASLTEFCDGIRRFAAPDLERVVRDLFAAAAARMREPADAAPPSAPVPIDLPWREALTISDVRRARRATGLSLDEISARAHIPTHLLRELEWGYLRNWPEGLYGRSQIVRYARAAGLDESVVLSVAWPLLEEAVALRGTEASAPVPAEQPIQALVPREPELLQPAQVIDAEVEVVEVPRRRGHAVWFAALAAAAMIVLALVPTMWVQVNRLSLPPEIASMVEIRRSAPPKAPADARGTTGSSSVDTGRTAADRTSVRGANSPTAQSSPPEVPRAIAEPVSYSPEFSNPGTAVFFSEPAAVGGVVRADTASRAETLKITRIVDDDAQNFHVRPSPDGAHIAFDSDREGLRAVFVADGDGHNVHRISGEGFAAMPSWSPDGTQLAFVKGEAHDPSVWNLWTTDLVSGNMRRLTSHDEGQPWGASWFPDGTRLAYSHGSELVVMTLADGARRTYFTPVRGHQVRAPAVSPDGRRIIFQVQRDGAWLLDVRSGSMRRVLDDPTAEEYTWSPDGHRVAFHSQKAGGWGVWVSGQQ